MNVLDEITTDGIQFSKKKYEEMLDKAIDKTDRIAAKSEAKRPTMYNQLKTYTYTKT